MLRHISSLYEYRDFLDIKKTNLNDDQIKRLSSATLKRALHKLKKLDVKLAEETLFEEYSEIGRPAIDPGIIF